MDSGVDGGGAALGSWLGLIERLHDLGRVDVQSTATQLVTGRICGEPRFPPRLLGACSDLLRTAGVRQGLSGSCHPLSSLTGSH